MISKGIALVRKVGKNMKKNVTINNWRLAWVENATLCQNNLVFTTAEELAAYGCKTIAATVPGNFELDFMREGLLDDIYVGVNTLQTQRCENLHLYYFTEFEYTAEEGFDANLCFEGIDTAAEIYLDGKKIAFVENMFHAHRFSLKGVSEGKHEVLVHIIPATIYARQFDIPAMCWGMKYNHDGIEMRKAGSMFGWDIMPRIVSGGLWKPVYVEYLPKARIVNPFTYTVRFTDKTLKTAVLTTTMRIETEHDFISDYHITIVGKCGDSEFRQEYRPFCAGVKIDFHVDNPKLWWPKNYGEQNLYDVEITLSYKGVECDKVSYRFGIRTVWLKRTSQSGVQGDFCFIVNNQRIFVMGTNWVPCDALPSRHDEYTLRNIQMANELGCNMIRCWGGNVYPSDVLYDYCDEHGIMIWQDFAIACGHYPDDDRLCALMKEEVKQIAIEKRLHPSLVVWAGDNECDCFVVPGCDVAHTDEEMPAMLNPNYNQLTRGVILRELRNHDATRPYIPSSPYLDEVAWRYGMPSENHLWGPRDFFKGNFYGTAQCHFASEIGYHGCPSPESIKKFIPAESLPNASITEIYENPDWLIHAAGIEPCVEGNPYAYRLPLMVSQVERIFGEASDDLSVFARQSQISQAEAKKYFIEMFRAAKCRTPHKTGILWWNVADGWPQVSDAIVDWYGCKKLAYSYIKRSQKPFCMFCDEPKNGELELLATNDTQAEQTARYTVENVVTGEVVAQGEVTVEANGIVCAAKLPDAKGAFYCIRWETATEQGINHFVCNIGEGWTYEAYKACMEKVGFYDDFEGFEGV